MPGWIPLALAFVAVAATTPGVLRLARRCGFVDHPSKRRFHAHAVPLGGGVAIVGGILLGLTPAWGRQLVLPFGPAALAGLLLVVVLGLADDRRGMHPLLKFGGQGLAAVALLWGCGLLTTGPLGAWTGPVALVWVVGLVNACNFLDNMDGILAGISALGGFAFWGLAAASGETGTAVVAAALAGGSLGFLLHNFAPARIFMGDAGSMALGYLLAAISLVLVPERPSAVALAPLMAVVLVLGYPLFDITFVTITRVADGRKVYLGGRDHSSHRLHRLLRDPRRTALAVYAVTALSAGLGVALGWHPSPLAALGSGGAALVLMVALGRRLARVPVV